MFLFQRCVDLGLIFREEKDTGVCEASTTTSYTRQFTSSLFPSTSSHPTEMTYSNYFFYILAGMIQDNELELFQLFVEALPGLDPKSIVRP